MSLFPNMAPFNVADTYVSRSVPATYTLQFLHWAFYELIRLEKVDIRTLRSIAKIIGTVLCVGGAVSMVLLRGPKLLNSSGGENWLVGSFLLFGSSCCWSFWIIFQVLKFCSSKRRSLIITENRSIPYDFIAIITMVILSNRFRFQLAIQTTYLYPLGCVSWQHCNQALLHSS